ncbi:Type I polyketide synthase [Zobellia galactanivorans]|uniref:Type I polyketide synthase n=2 Tax=Zobellia galactanivorans (strain DSM 12802 / CCUG 47099 / CIP 106680 / NCIMB 13871 / Dsij) TaxID=63186 RepID=G0L0V3_ZOBGA|nr:Type I polyketide synthase [Zobellia galactanivorans]
MTMKQKQLAIIGVGCRFPGNSNTPEQFWDLLKSGTDAIINVPKSRWDNRRFFSQNKNRKGKTFSSQFGFLTSDVTEFDPLFFGISPFEAETLDPQQRLLLQTTWEAFEDAGIPESKFRGSDTGVFIGGFTLDNKLIQLGSKNRNQIKSPTATSCTMAMLSNRISYSLDLRGPSLSIDTACSSSLVGIHYACQSIWAGESKMAIAGGVNLMLKPEYPIVMSKGQFLSSHSRCKTFDADAQGYVRGEGVGVILIKPLEEALLDNDIVYAVIHQTGSNQDGKTEGITVPNGDSQKQLLRKVIDQSEIDPNDICYVEAHGTGTPTGDPIEFSALDTVIKEKVTKEEHVAVGSVKTNIGHLEAASGVAGLIKAILVLKYNQTVPHLHFTNPNPQIDFENAKLKVSTDVRRLSDQQERYGLVNSFGYGGTNANVLLSNTTIEQKELPSGLKTSRVYILPLTAKSDYSLRAYAKKIASHLTEDNYADTLYTLLNRRSKLNTRAIFVANSMDELMWQLNEFAEGNSVKGVQTYTATTELSPKLFIFTGMGPQWFAMGRDLYHSSELFKQKWEEYDMIFQAITGWSMLEELLKEKEDSRIKETQFAQPANFFLQAALTELWASYGITPDAVLGHSVGEVTAAYVSGALRLKDCLIVSYHRSRIQQKAAGKGSMLAVGLPENEINQYIEAYGDVSVAAINSPSTVTLAGKTKRLQHISNKLTELNVFNKMLEVDVAYHSYQMDGLKRELLDSLDVISPQPPEIPIYSSVTARKMEGASFNNTYWWDNVRQPVRFSDAIVQTLSDGYHTMLEVGPHPVLRHSINECAERLGKKTNLLFSLRRKEDGEQHILDNLAHFYAIGYAIDWSKFYTGGNHIKLPLYEWENQSYFSESNSSREDRLGLEGHPFLNQTYPYHLPSFEMEVNEQFLPYLQDHVVSGAVVFPGAAYVEAILAMNQKVSGTETCTLKDVLFSNVLIFNEDEVQFLNTTFNPSNSTCDIFSHSDESNSWTQHASAKVIECINGKHDKIAFLATLKAFEKERTIEGIYDALDAIGLKYGPVFRGIQEIKCKGDKELLVKIKPHKSIVKDHEYLLHPSILDACFQSVIAALNGREVAPGAFVPTKINFVHFHTRPKLNEYIYCHAEITEIGHEYLIANMTLIGKDGTVIAQLEGLNCQSIESNAQNEERDINELFYEFNWKNIPLLEGEPDFENETILFFGPSSKKAKPFMDDLKFYGAKVIQMDQFDKNLLEQEKNSVTRLIYAPFLDEKKELSYKAVQEITFPLLSFFQSLKGTGPVQLVILTLNGHQVLDTDDMNINSGALLGLNHVIGNEHPNISPLSLDTDHYNLENPKSILLQLLGVEEDIALRGNSRFVRSLSKPSEPKVLGFSRKAANDEPFQIIHEKGKGAEGFSLVESTIVEPSEDEITLKVKSASLNFKDVLKINGQISQDALKNSYFQNSISMEVVGTVINKGKNVSDIAIGDDILMLAKDGGFTRYITTKPDFYVKKATTLSYDEMNIAIPFITAWHALVDKADLSEGETVLIHNGTGGVGLAAIQIAKKLNAKIITTTSTEEKRAHLRAEGVEHILYSRSLDYVKDVMDITDGKGVDVVLNAISGESLVQSFELLADYGRFIEIGKKDIVLNKGLPMQTFNRNVSFFHIDIDQMFMQRPKKTHELLQILYTKFQDEDYKPIPVTSFPAKGIEEAFKFMNKSKHIGKVTLNFEEGEVELTTAKSGIDSDGAFLITGGTAGFGFEIAKWLIGKEVKKVVLCSRSGVKDMERQAFIDRVNKAGVTEVYVHKLDITNTDEVKKLIDSLSQDTIAFKGVFHGAMVLDDAFMKDLDEERFLRVMNPKVLGAINLHNALGSYALDFFLCFSSISSLIGNVGQGNYVAANAFLDNFSHWRNAQNLACTSLNLGVLAEVGVVSRNEHVGLIMDAAGVKGFDTRTALRMLDYILSEKPAQICFFDVDWEVWSAINPRVANSSRFKSIVDQFSGTNALSKELRSLVEELKDCGEKDRIRVILEKTIVVFANVMKMNPDSINPEEGINMMGVDSLVSVEIVVAIKAMLGVELSIMDLLNGSSLNRLSEIILTKVEEHLGGIVEN